jgi:hypothetical protein
VSTNDASHVGEPDAGALKLVRSVQALKHSEELGFVLYIKPYAVIPDKEHGLPAILGAPDFYHVNTLAEAPNRQDRRTRDGARIGTPSGGPEQNLAEGRPLASAQAPGTI